MEIIEQAFGIFVKGCNKRHQSYRAICFANSGLLLQKCRIKELPFARNKGLFLLIQPYDVLHILPYCRKSQKNASLGKLFYCP